MRDDGQVRVVPLVGVQERARDAVRRVAGESRRGVEVFDAGLLCVCVCVVNGKREREREKKGGGKMGGGCGL